MTDDITYAIGEDPITKLILEEVKHFNGLIEYDTKKLQELAIVADKILRDELSGANFKYDFAEVRIYDLRTVGIQGDKRTYVHPVEVTIKYKGSLVWDVDFVARLSTRIPNEVEGVNRVIYTIF